MHPYLVTAKNYSEDSENRIHSDEIAKKYGFRGALVPGVAVYGHLTHPLVERFGAQWLTGASTEVRLLKPTYDGEQMSIRATEQDNPVQVTSHGPDGVLTTSLTSTVQQPSAPLQDVSLLEGPIKLPERTVIAWDNVIALQCFSPWQFHLSSAENKRYTSEVADQLPLYSQGYVHPHLILSLANTALMHEYVMPTWIHASSLIVHHQALMENDTITVRPVTLEKWQKKGHEFIKIWVTYWRDDKLTTEINHTAIFKVAT